MSKGADDIARLVADAVAGCGHVSWAWWDEEHKAWRHDGTDGLCASCAEKLAREAYDAGTTSTRAMKRALKAEERVRGLVAFVAAYDAWATALVVAREKLG